MKCGCMSGRIQIGANDSHLGTRAANSPRQRILGKLGGGSTRLPRACHWLSWMPAHSVYCKPDVVVVAAGGDDDDNDSDQAYSVLKMGACGEVCVREGKVCVPRM